MLIRAFVTKFWRPPIRSPHNAAVPDRQVIFNTAFFDALDAQLPEFRTASGGPSATDFLLHDLPRLRDLLPVEQVVGSARPGVTGKVDARSPD